MRKRKRIACKRKLLICEIFQLMCENQRLTFDRKRFKRKLKAAPFLQGGFRFYLKTL